MLVASSNNTAKMGITLLDCPGRICDGGVLCLNKPNSNLRRTAVGPLPASMVIPPYHLSVEHVNLGVRANTRYRTLTHKGRWKYAFQSG